MKFTVLVTGVVESDRKRTLSVYADSPEEAIRKSYSMFESSIQKSKRYKNVLKNVTARLIEESGSDSSETD